MPPITTEPKREVVADFARQIREKKAPGPKPAFDVIHFRSERLTGFERPVELVPIGLLRYRKDNGRIASDVLNYEKTNGPLDEKDTADQAVLRKFLAEKDPEPTETLSKSIAHIGQKEAAIITCDGFLINGNRRKMVLDKLRELEPGKADYEFMKVVILPGPNDPGGAPSLLEIERLENRYQLQSEGKSEYYGFDRALSIQRKIDLGFGLEEQLRDDPQYAKASVKEIAQAVKDTERDYLHPLACVNRYLQTFRREGLYGTVSEGRSDKEGRWQAFLDYSNVYQRNLKSQQWLIANQIDEDDVGGLEDAAFKMIRLRDLKGLPKVHKVMRDLPKLSTVKDSRKEVLKISEEVPASLSKEDSYDEKGNPLSIEQADRKWVARHQQNLIHRLKKAMDIQEAAQNKETPLTLLEAALRKLNHEDMLVQKIGVADFDRARQLAAEIQKRAKEIEGEIYHYKKEHGSLGTKK